MLFVLDADPAEPDVASTHRPAVHTASPTHTFCGGSHAHPRSPAKHDDDDDDEDVLLAIVVKEVVVCAKITVTAPSHTTNKRLAGTNQHSNDLETTVMSVNVELRCGPLDSVDELLTWTAPSPTSLAHVATRSRVPLAATAAARSRLLIAHDFKGGYREDAVLNGTGDQHAYTMHDGWRYASEFVYFSHHFVSIPPVGWIEVGHAHGCRVYGTLITEWAEGRRTLNQMLRSHDVSRRCVEQLVAIALEFEFDGWLVNIENTVDNVDALRAFLADLTKASRAVGKTTIWYDSVTKDGELKWQNTLNSLNKEWFDVSDGIFTNYGWASDSPAIAASLAGTQRSRDVLFGIDVHGRGTFGGGRLTCDAAAKVALAADTSVALFAPGWTHENFSHSHVQLAVGRFFFDRLAPFFEPFRHGAMPFWTNFFPGSCGGSAQHVFVCGAKLSRTRVLTQLRLLRPQLSWSFEHAVEAKPALASFFAVGLCETDAFVGQVSLRLSGWLSEAPDAARVRLFATDFDLERGLVLSAALKLGAGCECALHLTLDNGSIVVLAPSVEIGAVAAAATCVTPTSVERHQGGWVRRVFHVGALAARRVRQLSAVALLGGEHESSVHYRCLIGDIAVRAGDIVAARCAPIVRAVLYEDADAIAWHHSEPSPEVVAYLVRWRDGSAQIVPTNVAFGRASQVLSVAPLLNDGRFASQHVI